MNTMLLEMHILKWYIVEPAEMEIQFFTGPENLFDYADMGVHDPYGHKKGNLKWNTHNVGNLFDLYIKTNQAWTLSLDWSNSSIFAIKVRYGRTL